MPESLLCETLSISDNNHQAEYLSRGSYIVWCAINSLRCITVYSLRISAQ